VEWCRLCRASCLVQSAAAPALQLLQCPTSSYGPLDTLPFHSIPLQFFVRHRAGTAIGRGTCGRGHLSNCHVAGSALPWATCTQAAIGVVTTSSISNSLPCCQRPLVLRPLSESTQYSNTLQCKPARTPPLIGRGGSRGLEATQLSWWYWPELPPGHSEPEWVLSNRRVLVPKWLVEAWAHIGRSGGNHCNRLAFTTCATSNG